MGTNTKNIKDITPPQPLATVEQDSPKPRQVIMGRPKGAKNKDTLFKELMTGQFQDIAEDQVGRTLQVLFEKAHEGDMKAIKLIMDRVVPVTKAVDLADMEKKGLTINISVGSMEEAALIEAEEIEDGDFTEMED
jgi:hypothetical protein